MTASLLVVDDNPDYRFLLRLALQTSSVFDVVGEADDPASARAAIARLAPDVLLLDLAMATDDGRALWPELQRAAPDAAVVLASSYPEENPIPFGRPGQTARLSRATPPHTIDRQLAATIAVLGRVELSLHRVTSTFAADPRSAREARRFVESALVDWECGAVLDTVTLLVSELVTNAVLHAGTDAEVTVNLRGDCIRVDVFDRDDDGTVQRRHAGVEDTSGRGTELVESLARSWGVERRPQGKSVWFEVPLDDPDTAL